jgi:hypothetical protein
MLFKSSFKGYASLTDLVNSWAKHWVRFIFSSSENLFEGFVGSEYIFNIFLS